MERPSAARPRAARPAARQFGALRSRAGLLVLGMWTATEAREIPVFHHRGPIKFEQYRQFTDNLTKPAIIRGYFDASVFADVCACDEKATLFDSIKLPYQDKGNPSHKLREAIHSKSTIEFQAINGGDFYRKHACDSSLDDYIFFDYNNGVVVSGNAQRFFSETMNPKLNISDITDEGYDAWLNELFIGTSTSEYPLPSENKSGSAPHRAPVLNYYYQICGKKRWHIADHGMSFGELDRFQYMLNESDMHAFMANEQVMSGFTEPGDLVLNPPWAWHFVQTAIGFNFAVTYKQLGYGWWAATNKMDPTQFVVNMKYGATDMREQKLPWRSVHDPPKELGGAFIVDLHDIRIPTWLLNRLMPKWLQATLVIIAFLVVVAGLRCCCCCGSRFLVGKAPKDKKV